MGSREPQLTRNHLDMVAERGMRFVEHPLHRDRREGEAIRVATREGILMQIQVDLGLCRGHGYLLRKGDLRTRGCVGQVHRRSRHRGLYPRPGED